ncbi:MAG: hypothetical protein A2046_00555 [Bacteroidetes bacterium GWA2_30_7]|nr:MAG: hypothetical protein A2046_00555 [Bacteroidetes bacterium GWA2_30_7]
MKLLYILVIIYVLLFKIINAQDISYARKIIDELSSEKFHGRGYTFNGDKKAAKYIANQLKENHINPIKGNYFQPFKINVNTFSSAIKLQINGVELIPGVDFILSSSSKECKGSYSVIILDSTIINNDIKYEKFLEKKYSDSFLLIDTSGVINSERKSNILNLEKTNIFAAKGIIVIANKLIFSVSTTESDFCTLYLKKALYRKLNFPIKNLEINFKNKFIENHETQNVAGIINGISDSLIVFTSHYDHLGTMGNNVFFPGANDNCSGVSLNLSLAKHYANIDTLKYSIAFLFFGAEEAGILGSKYFTEHPLFQLSKIKFLINLDLVGTGDDGICIVNGSVLKNEFSLFNKINAEKNLFPLIKSRGEAANSDHYFFYKSGVKSIFIYTLGGIGEYHNPFDISKTLPLTRYKELFTLLTEFVKLYE